MTNKQKLLIELDYASWLLDEKRRMPELTLREIAKVVRKYEERIEKEHKEMQKIFRQQTTKNRL